MPGLGIDYYVHPYRVSGDGGMAASLQGWRISTIAWCVTMLMQVRQTQSVTFIYIYTIQVVSNPHRHQCQSGLCFKECTGSVIYIAWWGGACKWHPAHIFFLQLLLPLVSRWKVKNCRRKKKCPFCKKLTIDKKQVRQKRDYIACFLPLKPDTWVFCNCLWKEDLVVGRVLWIIIIIIPHAPYSPQNGMSSLGQGHPWSPAQKTNSCVPLYHNTYVLHIYTLHCLPLTITRLR